ncbi:hypothetical protein KAU15_04510, partial [candidate division WOR-3 bacterium]|nr:hypothetical protein [candidate division WOR-3 bacterium]
MKGVEYLDITGVQSFTYISRELLSGELSNYYPYQDRRYSLDLNIRGKFEAGTAIEGYFKKSSRIEENDYINIKLFSNHWDFEFGNMNSISSNSFYKENKVIAVKGRVFNDKHLIEGGFGTPEGVYHFQYIEGDNTQGPYQLLNIPIISMTEMIYIIKDGSKTQLMNGSDYNIDYRTGRITLNFILTDDKGLEIEYYSQSWTSLSRVDYTVGSKSQFGIFSFGLNGGGVYFRGDNIGDSLNNYFSFGANAGVNLLNIMNLDMQVMSSVEKADSGYELSGTGISGNGNISYKILSLSANAYKSYNNFKRIGEFSNKEYTVIGIDGSITPMEWILLSGNYSKQLSDNTNSRTMGGKGKLSKEVWGSIEGGYNENYNYVNIGTNTKYSGYNAMYSNTMGKLNYYIKGNTGINSSINDTIINEYKKHNIGIGNTSKINDNIGLSFDILGEN